MDEIYNKIESIAAENNGFVKTSQIEVAGISRGVIKKQEYRKYESQGFL